MVHAMSEIRVRLACGCVQSVEQNDAPSCVAHDERKVWKVWAPAPRITSVGCEAKGPLVRVVKES